MTRPDLRPALGQAQLAASLDQLSNDDTNSELMKNMPLRAAIMVGSDARQLTEFLWLANHQNNLQQGTKLEKSLSRAFLLALVITFWLLVLAPSVTLCALRYSLSSRLSIPWRQFVLFSAIFALPTPPVSVRIIIVRSFICRIADYYDLG